MSVLQASRLDVSSLGTQVLRTLVGVEDVWVYSLPLNVSFRGVRHREGLLIRGEYGWGEAAPFTEYCPAEASRWLSSALVAARMPLPQTYRTHVAVNVTIPVVSAQEAQRRVLTSGGCTTAKVKVADPRSSLSDDCERVAAVADALRDISPDRARIRVDVNGAWDVDEALVAIRELQRAADVVGGLEYVEQPCMRVEDMAQVRRRCVVRIAADESIRRAEDPLRVAQLGAADVAVVKVAPLGGWQRMLRIGADTGLDMVVSSALESSVGLATGVWAAGAVEDLPFACGLATTQILAADVSSTPLRVEDGCIAVRSVDPDRLATAPALAADRVKWWSQHLRSMCSFL